VKQERRRRRRGRWTERSLAVVTRVKHARQSARVMHVHVFGILTKGSAWSMSAAVVACQRRRRLRRGAEKGVRRARQVVGPLLPHRHRSRYPIGPCVSPVVYNDACNTMTHAMTAREARCGRESGPWSKRPAMRSIFRPTECARASTACIARRRRRKALQVTTP
jgi:hypothetical protein